MPTVQPPPRGRNTPWGFRLPRQCDVLVRQDEGISKEMSTHFQPQAGCEDVGVEIARETPIASDRIFIFIVARQAGSSVHRAAYAPKAQCLDHETFDILRVA